MRIKKFVARLGTKRTRPAGDRGQQEGQTLVLVAVALVVLVLFAAIAADASDAYFGRRTAQNAADAAALAGGRALGEQSNNGSYNDDAIKAAMDDFAEQNDVLDTNASPADEVNDNVVGYYLDENGDHLTEVPIGTAGDAFAAEAWGIEAVTTITAPTFFGGIIGLDGMPVHATAAVMMEGVCAASCVVPIAAFQLDFQSAVGQCYKVWNGSGPGNFGWLNWSRQREGDCSCSEPCTEFNLDPATCRSGLVGVGEYLASDSGVSNAQGIRQWLDYYGGFPPKYSTAVPFTVPVWDEALEGPACNPDGQAYRVAGFAKVQLIAYKLSGGPQTGEVPADCIELQPADPEDPTYKDRNWIAITFIQKVEGMPGNCEAHGSLLIPRLVK
jgi:Flp pilus assembly protein TadG